MKRSETDRIFSSVTSPKEDTRCYRSYIGKVKERHYWSHFYKNEEKVHITNSSHFYLEYIARLSDIWYMQCSYGLSLFTGLDYNLLHEFFENDVRTKPLINILLGMHQRKELKTSYTSHCIAIVASYNFKASYYMYPVLF